MLVTDPEAFVRELKAHKLSLHRQASCGWAFVESIPQWGNLGALAFSKELSLALKTEVIDIALQTTASFEEVIHWDQGKLRRKLVYAGDGDGWVTSEGDPQEWEPAYFFAEDEGTSEGETWPSNLADDVSDEDVARYNKAKASGDASSVLELLWGGSVWRIFEYYGVNFSAPVASFCPPPSRRLGFWVASLVVLMVGAVVLGMFYK